MCNDLPNHYPGTCPTPDFNAAFEKALDKLKKAREPVARIRVVAGSVGYQKARELYPNAPEEPSKEVPGCIELLLFESDLPRASGT